MAFAGNKITTIGQYAFADCVSLERMTLPTSVTTIGTRAFYRSGIKYLSGTDNVARVEDIAFMNSQLVEIDLTKATFIGSSAFAGCYKLKTVILGGSAVVRSNVAVADQNIFTWSTYVTIYVPDALVNEYKSTYPWSVYSDVITAKASS